MTAPAEPQPVGTPAEQSEHRDVPTVTEHNEWMHANRPGDCLGR